MREDYQQCLIWQVWKENKEFLPGHLGLEDTGVITSFAIMLNGLRTASKDSLFQLKRQKNFGYNRFIR